MATLNFPDSPTTGDTYTDSNSGFTYEWNGSVWISTDPSTASNIKEIDDISSGFNGSLKTFNLTINSIAFEPVNAQQILVAVNGSLMNPVNDYTVSGSQIIFTTAPTGGHSFVGTYLGTALSLNTIADNTVGPTALTTTSNYVMNGVTLDQGAGIITAYGFKGGYVTADLDSTFSGNVSIAGSLTVQGTQTIIHTDELNIQDKTIGIGSTSTPTSTSQDGAGVLIYGQTNVSILYDNDKAALGISTGVNVAGFVTATRLVATGATVGSGVTINNTGIDVGIGAGIITAKSFVGGGSGLTGVAATDNIITTKEAKLLGGVRMEGFTTSATMNVTGVTTLRDDVRIASANGSDFFFDKSDNSFKIGDSITQYFGSDNDLWLMHNGSTGYISNTTGDLYIRDDGGDIYIQAKSGENSIVAKDDGSVDLYYDNSKKFETLSVGSTVTGIQYATSFSGAIASWTLGASGSDHYTFDGPGLTGAESDPTLYLQRGKRYNFVNSSGASHPIQIQREFQDTSGTAYNDGITNNPAAGTGVTLEWDVQFDTPDVLYYQCTNHANMSGKIYIGNSGDSAIIGTGVTINNTGVDAGIGAGIVTASAYYGSGANLSNLPAATGLTGTPDITVNNITGAAATFTGNTVQAGITSITGALHLNNILTEKVNITAGRLSDNTNIDLEDGMLHYFSTTENTTCTPNIRYNASTSLNDTIGIGSAISVSLITTAAAAGYSAQLNIDGSGQTEEWNGGEAPSAGGDGGLDIYTYTILKTASATYKCLCNVTNFN